MEKLAITRVYKKEDTEEVLKLVNETLTPPTSAKLWEWLFHDNPFRPREECNLVVERGGRILGVAFNVFVKLKLKDKSINSRWGCFFSVHPDFRGEGLALFDNYQKIPYYPFLGFVKSIYLQGLIGIGFIKIAHIYSRIRVLELSSYIQNRVNKDPFEHLIKLILRTFSFVSLKLFSTEIVNDLVIEENQYFDSRFDAFWNEVSKEYPIITERSSRYLNWRFVAAPFKYKIFSAVRKDKIAGYIVVRLTENNRIKKGLIIDLLADSSDYQAIDSLLKKAVAYFGQFNCCFADCIILTDKKNYRRALIENGFLIKRFRHVFGAYSDEMQDLLVFENPKNWFITASDPDLELMWS